MNEQLLSHLESFDSDEEYSESPAAAKAQEPVGPILNELNVFNIYVLKTRRLWQRFSAPESFKEGFIKVLWLLPISIVLGEYLGFFMSLSLSLIGFFISQLQPEPHHYHEEMTGHEHSMHLRQVSFSETSKRRSTERECHPISKKQVQDCRKEISRLLGLIGAPALDWSDPQATNFDDDEALGISSEAAIQVVKFLEAHVQLLLAVDEAYRWLQISASLHLGLGPRSQCVERVERASIAREFRNGRRQSIGGSLIAHGVQDTAKEPQRGLCKSVLSLSNVRQHLAQAMVDQSDSILQVWHHLQNEMGTSHEVSHTEPLDIPDVVDLVWIRTARHQIASMLSDSVNIYCTIDVLAKLTASDGVRSLMEASMSNARNTREYLLCNMLLGKRRVADPLPYPNDPLLLSLMRYREQLDALSGAIWSCQQYSNSELASNEHGRAEWWIQIRQLSETCRAMESEIGQHFFAMPDAEGEGGGLTTDGSDHGFNHLQHGAANEDVQTYQRDDDGWESPTEKKTDDRSQGATKAMIYKGIGVKAERSAQASASSNGASASASLPLPPRDTVSETQMIRELQNRITMMRPPDDDDSEEEKETDVAKAARLGRAPAAPLFLGATGTLLNELKESSLLAGAEEEQVLGE